MTTTTSRDLAARLADLLRREHFALADFLVALAEFDRQRCWRDLGYAGLFDYLHRDLGLSKGTAFYRKTAAELVQRYPEVIDPLRDGRLCITSVVELARVITPENRADVLPRFFHRSRLEAKAVSAELSPVLAPPRRVVVTAAPTPRCLDLAQAVQPVELACPESTAAVPEPPRDAHRACAPPRRSEAVPLTADLLRLHVTVSKQFLDKLEAARVSLSHSHPRATTEAILEVALDLVLARDARKKGLVAKPRPAGPTPPSGDRHVPASVRRAVWERDGGRCQWPLASGGICGSTARVEIDHVDPIHRGGCSTVENTRLLCRAHNDLAARQVLGEGYMDLFTGCGRRPSWGLRAAAHGS